MGGGLALRRRAPSPICALCNEARSFSQTLLFRQKTEFSIPPLSHRSVAQSLAVFLWKTLCRSWWLAAPGRLATLLTLSEGPEQGGAEMLCVGGLKEWNAGTHTLPTPPPWCATSVSCTPAHRNAAPNCTAPTLAGHPDNHHLALSVLFSIGLPSCCTNAAGRHLCHTGALP